MQQAERHYIPHELHSEARHASLGRLGSRTGVFRAREYKWGVNSMEQRSALSQTKRITSPLEFFKRLAANDAHTVDLGEKKKTLEQ